MLEKKSHRAYEPGEFRRTKEAGTPEEQHQRLTEELGRITTQIRGFAEQAQAAHGQLSTETKAKIDELLAKQAEIKTELNARLTEIEQKMARRGARENEQEPGLGQMVSQSEEYKAFAERAQTGYKGSVAINVKTITSFPASAGVLVRPERLPGILPIPQARLTVRDLLTPGRTGSNLLEYIRETGFTNLADVVSEGTQKPESTLTFALVQTAVATIAHWVQATRQILADAAQLESYIEGRLRFGLAYVEEMQLLKGSGTGGNLEGIMTVATPYSAAFAVPNESFIDKLRLAMLQSELALFPATGMVLHPTDWARIELTKDLQGRYIFANPQQLQGPTLWGLPVVSTPSMDADSFLVGAFKLGAQIFDRENATVLVSTEDRDNFIKNLVTILAEERLALAIYRPEAFIAGDFGEVT